MNQEERREERGEEGDRHIDRETLVCASQLQACAVCSGTGVHNFRDRCQCLVAASIMTHGRCDSSLQLLHALFNNALQSSHEADSCWYGPAQLIFGSSQRAAHGRR